MDTLSHSMYESSRYSEVLPSLRDDCCTTFKKTAGFWLSLAFHPFQTALLILRAGRRGLCVEGMKRQTVKWGNTLQRTKLLPGSCFQEKLCLFVTCKLLNEATVRGSLVPGIGNNTNEGQWRQWTALIVDFNIIASRFAPFIMRLSVLCYKAFLFLRYIFFIFGTKLLFIL